MGFISYDDNVGAIANLGINGFVILGREFLYGGEDNATRIYVEQFPHCLAIASLLGGLTSQLTAPGEGIEKLVVEVVAIGEDNYGGVSQYQNEFAALVRPSRGIYRCLGYATSHPVALFGCSVRIRKLQERLPSIRFQVCNLKSSNATLSLEASTHPYSIFILGV